MAEWQRRIWLDIGAVEDALPPPQACVLVVGDALPTDFSADVRVVRRAYGEAMGDEAGFHRIFLLAQGGVARDYPLLLEQMWRLLRPDGLLVVVAARPNPWGLRGTAWWRGYPRRLWLRWLKQAHWLVADDVTVGFSAAWGRWIPCGGPVRVILAQKRVGGAKVWVAQPEGTLTAKPVGVPV